jgi:hypothetical protein
MIFFSVKLKLQTFAANTWKHGSRFGLLESQIRLGQSIPDHWNLHLLQDLYENMCEVMWSPSAFNDQQAQVNLEFQSEKRELIVKLLPKIVDLAEKLKDEHKSVLPKLTAGTSAEIYLTREELACVLANCFLCKFPNSLGQHDTDFVQLNFIG